jgi:hypothetical protein
VLSSFLCSCLLLLLHITVHTVHSCKAPQGPYIPANILTHQSSWRAAKIHGAEPEQGYGAVDSMCISFIQLPMLNIPTSSLRTRTWGPPDLSPRLLCCLRHMIFSYSIKKQLQTLIDLYIMVPAVQILTPDSLGAVHLTAVHRPLWLLGQIHPQTLLHQCFHPLQVHSSCVLTHSQYPQDSAEVQTTSQQHPVHQKVTHIT